MNFPHCSASIEMTTDLFCDDPEKFEFLSPLWVTRKKNVSLITQGARNKITLLVCYSLTNFYASFTKKRHLHFGEFPRKLSYFFEDTSDVSPVAAGCASRCRGRRS